MKFRCIFRVEVEGYLWRVIESCEPDSDGMRVYKVLHLRRVYARYRRANGQIPIEECLQVALGCGVSIGWRNVL